MHWRSGVNRKGGSFLWLQHPSKWLQRTTHAPWGKKKTADQGAESARQPISSHCLQTLTILNVWVRYCLNASRRAEHSSTDSSTFRTLSTKVGVRNGGQNQANCKELNGDHFNNQAVTASSRAPRCMVHTRRGNLQQRIMKMLLNFILFHEGGDGDLEEIQVMLGPMLPNAPVLQFLCQGHLGKLPFFSSSYPTSIALHHLMWSLSSNWTFLDFVPELSFLQALLVEAYISVCLVSKGTLLECLLYFGAGPWFQGAPWMVASGELTYLLIWVGCFTGPTNSSIL